MDRENYNYNVDDVENFEDFIEYYEFDKKYENEDDEPKELDFG